MNADDLRAVAAEIREKATNDLTPGPWAVRHDCPRDPVTDEIKEHHCDWDEVWIAGYHGATVADFGERYTSAPRDAEHLVRWTPPVALAVAAWLDETARQLGFRNDGARVDLRFVARAEAFVKAWRGES